MGIASLLKLKRKDIWALTISCLLGFFVGRSIVDPTWSVFASMLLSYHLFLGWLIFTGEKQVKLSLPILATVGIHLVFLIIIVGLTMAREYIPAFRLVKYALAAIGIFERWLVFNAASHRHNSGQSADQMAGQLDQQIGGEPLTASGAAAQQPATPLVAASLPVTAMAASAPHPQASAPAPQSASPLATAFRQDTSISDSIRRKPAENEVCTNPIASATGEDHEAWLHYLSTRNPTHRKAGLSMADEYRDWLLVRFKARASQSATSQPAIAR